MSNEVFNVVLASIPLVVALIGLAVPVVNKAIKQYNLENLVFWVKQAVNYAEMMYHEKGSGAEKKRYCVQFISRLVNSKRQIITDEQISVLIESAVKELHLNEKKAEG